MIIGLLIVSLAFLLNFKDYTRTFASKKRLAEREKKVNEAYEKIIETPMGKNMMDSYEASITFSLVVNFLFHLVISIVVANPFMYILGATIFLLNLISSKTVLKNFRNNELKVSNADKISLPLKTVHIIGFFVLFFL